MKTAADTALRYLAMLQLIPAYPDKVSVAQLGRKLKEKEYVVTPRTIQRDLERLSRDYPITCDKDGRTNRWYFTDKSALAQIPAMGDATALVLKLAEEYLSPLLPPAGLDLLQPYFRHARQVLAKTKLGKWQKKVKIIRRGPELIPPNVRPDVRSVIYQSLLEERQLRATYKARGRDEYWQYVLNPLGIVIRNSIIYLVATVGDYGNPVHFALHRMRSAEMLPERLHSLADFDLDSYVAKEKEFSYPVSPKPIRLHVLFDSNAGYHLTESRLSADQKMKKRNDGRWELKATVDNTDELRWWLRGFGGLAEVLSPKALRHEFRESATISARSYKRV